ncbi:hypothetical protein LINGRAHAP2_LOCUS5496 [Linum grandiflorum]
MSGRKSSSRKRTADAAAATAKSAPPVSKFRLDDDFQPDLSSDLKGIMSALHQIRAKTEKDGQKMKEETVSSVASEFRSMFNDLKTKIDKDRQTFGKALQKNSKECENYLKSESTKIQDMYERFSKEKAAHMQSMQETISKFEEDKERLLIRYEQLSKHSYTSSSSFLSSSVTIADNTTICNEFTPEKKEKNMLAEYEKACDDKIAKLGESLKKKKQDDKTFNILRKTLGTFLDNASDDDFPPDE